MGLIQSVKSRMERWWGTDKESHLLDKTKGVSNASGVSAQSSLNEEGMNDLTSMLSVDHAIMLRYADYEQMDDYPELCLAGESLIFTLKDGWITIRELAERGGEFYVLSYSKEARSLIPAKASGARRTGDVGHGKPMVRVVMDDGHSIRCTEDHPFMTKDERWVRACDLKVNDRLMPVETRMKSLNSVHSLPYWWVRQPHPDSDIKRLERSGNERRWMSIHRLAALIVNGDSDAEAIHSDDWRRKISDSQPNNLHLSRERVEGALSEGGNVAEAARILGVAWSTVKRAAVKHDLIGDGGNHRVVRVDHLDVRCEIYDITVPEYHNFACNGVIVHNSGILDVYADDSTIPDSIRGKSIWGESKDKVIRDIIDDCLHRRLRLEEDIWLAMRTLCKYGDTYGELLLSEKGVLGLNWLPAPTMRRVVNCKGALLGFVQDTSGMFDVKMDDVMDWKGAEKKCREKGLVYFKPWEVVHWRLRSKHINSIYGVSILDGARWVWKRLQLLEDTALQYKLTRSPSRFIYYIDTGDIPPAEAMALVKKVKQGFRKKTLINPTTGKLDFRYNPISPNEDVFIPTRGGKESTRVDVLSGLDWQNLEDLEYFRNKMLSALKVPRGYLDQEGDDNRASLAQKDVRFARTAMRIQREFRNGIRKILRIHMALLNIDPDSVKWETKMTVPSSIFEMQQIEVLNAQADLAERLEKYFPKEWLLQRILHLSDDEATSVINAKDGERDRDEKEMARTQAEIQSMYPSLEMPDDKQEDVAPQAGRVNSDKALRKLDELLRSVKETIQTNDAVVQRLGKLEPRLGRLDAFMKKSVVLNERRRLG